MGYLLSSSYLAAEDVLIYCWTVMATAWGIAFLPLLLLCWYRRRDYDAKVDALQAFRSKAAVAVQNPDILYPEERQRLAQTAGTLAIRKEEASAKDDAACALRNHLLGWPLAVTLAWLLVWSGQWLSHHPNMTFRLSNFFAIITDRQLLWAKYPVHYPPYALAHTIWPRTPLPLRLVEGSLGIGIVALFLAAVARGAGLFPLTTNEQELRLMGTTGTTNQDNPFGEFGDMLGLTPSTGGVRGAEKLARKEQRLADAAVVRLEARRKVAEAGTQMFNAVAGTHEAMAKASIAQQRAQFIRDNPELFLGLGAAQTGNLPALGGSGYAAPPPAQQLPSPVSSRQVEDEKARYRRLLADE